MFAEIEALATAICDGSTDPLLFEQALIFAENAFVLRCVQTERIATIDRHRDLQATPLASGDHGFASVNAAFARAELAHETFVNANSGAPSSTGTDSSKEAHIIPRQERERAVRKHPGRGKPAERDEFDAMRSAMPDLDRLERYRRRAWSRERRAIRDFLRSNQRV